ncbi:ParB/RepB/Spo0J family partition protein [Desulfovibrio sp. OttesenSCG-928-A18]|nr:ParB/RepB/Spo0J family partition protein [Desulfovibrio sp. OttesenSCG-928-A18]
MALHTTGLGKGLDALIRANTDSREKSKPQSLLLIDIRPNPLQPRKNFDDAALRELADSIKSQGLLQPLLVRPLSGSETGKYEIVAGERRWRAASLAGLREVPVFIRSLTDEETLLAGLIENLQREDLNPIEEARALQTLKQEFALSQDVLAQKIGKSRSAVANSLRLLALPEKTQDLLAEGRISPGHARAILSISDKTAMELFTQLMLEKNLSVREAEGLAAAWKEKGSFDMPALAAPAVSSAQDADINEEGGHADAGASAAEADTGTHKEQVRKKPQSARLLEIQQRFVDLLQVPVKVTGKEAKGRISFSFNSKEELEQLLNRLSAFVLEAEEHAALQGAGHEALAGNSSPALGAADRAEVSGTSRAAIAGDTKNALSGAEHDELFAQDHSALSGKQQNALGQKQDKALPHRQVRALDSHAADAPSPLADLDAQESAAENIKAKAE